MRTAVRRGGSAVLVLLLAGLAAGDTHIGLATVLTVLATALALASHRSLRLARRSRVGAASEALVRRTLRPLMREGWDVRHGLDWPGPGDLDHVVRAPSGIGFVIETKTLRWTDQHAARTLAAARWLVRRRGRYAGRIVPVICVVRARRIERADGRLLIVSSDRLLSALRAIAAADGAYGGRTAHRDPGRRFALAGTRDTWTD